MSSEISETSSFMNQSEMDEEFEVYVEYESETYALDEVTNYKSLCQQIEESIEGVKAQDLKITYKTSSGIIVTVKNDSTFNTARKKMKPELKFTCSRISPPATTAPITVPSQPVNNELQKTDSLGTTSNISNQKPPLQEPDANVPITTSPQAANLSGPIKIAQNPLIRSTNFNSQSQNPVQYYTDFHFVPLPSSVNQQPVTTIHESAHGINTTPQMPYAIPSLTHNDGQQPHYQETYPDIQTLDFRSNQQPSLPNNQFPPIFQPPEEQKNYPSLVIQGQDAARCACGQFLNVSSPQMGTCPNQGCMLKANQTYTQLWSCQNQSDVCGYYCWMCVQNKLRNCQICVFEDVNQKNQVFINRRNQELKCQPNYNPAPFVPTPTPPNVSSQPTLNPEIYVHKKPQEIQNFTSFEQNSKLFTCNQSTVSQQLPQQIQPHQNVEQKQNKPSDGLILQQDDAKTIQISQKVVEAPNQLLIEVSSHIEQKILGLEKNDLKQLESEVVEYFQENQTLEDDFIDYLCTQFKLDERKSELLKFCQKYDPKPPAKKKPTLPKIEAYLTKKKIIDFVLNDLNTPQGYKLKKEFESLTGDQLAQFKECNKDFNAISFIEDDLFKEETQLVSQLFIDNKSSQEISKITLIHVELVEKICSLKENIIKKEIELLDLIRKYSSCKSNEDVIKLIDKDDYELVKVLIQAYIDNKDEYLKITLKLKDKNFAKNFESSQDLTTALKEIDDEEERRRLPPVPIIIEPKILGLDQNSLEELKSDVIQQIAEAKTIENDFLDHLCETYNLDEKRKELIEFLEQFTQQQAEIQYPKLPKIKVYQTKKKIIDFILNDENIPNSFKLKKEFENLTKNQLVEFKDCYHKNKAISFLENDLFDQEQELLYQLQNQKKSNEEIQKITLIHINLIQKFCDLKVIKLKEDTFLLGLIRKWSSCKTDDEIIQLIVKDDNELAKLLLKIYKENKKGYHEITQKLRDKNYAINFEQSQLQQLIKLAALPNLDTRIEQQKEVVVFLDHFLNQDLVAYLMLLHDFSDIGQSVIKNNIERIILNQPHKDLRTAMVQLLILEMDQEKKNEVIESKIFQDSREEDKLKQLSEQIEHYKAQQFQKLKNEEQVDDESFQSDLQHVHLNKENYENEELINTIQAISNITNMKIQVHSKSELTKNNGYTPEAQEAKGTLYLVRDDLKKVFYVMIQYENEKKIIDSLGLQALKQKYLFLSQKIPAWLDTFIQLPSLRMFLNECEVDPKKMFEDFSQTQNEFLEIRDEACKKKLYNAAVKFNLDSQLMQEWFNIQNQNKIMADFCNFMINKGTRQKPHWAITQVENIQKYFPMNAKKQSLKDFNRVQTYQDPDDRKRHIEQLKSQPEELTSFIINTLFGVILRKDDMSLIQSELEQIIQGSTISLRFLVSYLLQSSDMGLRARLNYYLCQNKSIPLIMNCQQTFKDSNFMNYNQELVFSILDNEGVGVLAYGIGKQATNPCGKSEISNLIVTPKFDNKSFDVYDLNVFSNGQIDVFFEKCYQKKSGWAFMDGSGKIPDSSLLSVLPLTNIVLIHFLQKDQDDITSVIELEETIKLIKGSDSSIQVCLILRDCTETKEINKSKYPAWLPCKDKIDKLIELINVQNENRIVQKSTQIEKIMLYFNETVAKIQSQKKSKFTKENFLFGFCKMDSQGTDTYKRIKDILILSEDFIKEVQVLKVNVFDQQGLPSLKIKDQIREISLKLRQFESVNGEDTNSSLKREEVFQSQLNKLTDQLSKLEVNKVMQQFWKIVNHEDAVQIKIEVSKSLSKFTEENIQDLDFQKKNFMNKNAQAKKDGRQSKEEIQLANDEYKQKMKEFEDEIFKRSLSYEYFWRSLICVMVDSKQCNYWTDNLNKEIFKNAVRKQMLDGDTFELIDGRNLEMKADIIKQIVGYDIECTKCIVVCVIGPQSTGKSTLMNFCFGTQFLASTGRCTQGIYFTLQKIPPEMKNGSDVDYLIILDTEGLNSPERAEGDRPDSEYDRKIVLFTLLCSDFLIINSSGDMSLQMKELIKICAVRYDELRAHAKAPKILYTFVKNSDTNPEKFKEQIQSLRSDVIESSDEPTIEKTANELMAVHEDLVKVLGNAYDQKLIEKDQAKGILYSTFISTCAPLFGVHASDVWKQVQNFIQSGQHQFRQIGAWLQEAGQHWSLIDKHGANITQFGNVQQMKNDRKIKQYISKLWQQYIDTQITSKDNQKAQEKCLELYDRFRDGENIEPWKKKFIEENDKDKENDFFVHIEDKYSRWKLEPSQRTITVGAELIHMKVCEIKMVILKNDYKLLIENKFKEFQMTQIPARAIAELYRKARNMCQVIKKIPEVEQDLQINQEFQKSWGKLEQEISSESKIEKMRKSNAEYHCSTFRSINKFMSEITQVQFKNILEASNSFEMYPNSTLPKRLVDYLVNHISNDAFKDENYQGALDTKGQFQFDLSMLGMLTEDPKQRIFGQSSDAVKEKYLPLQKMLKVDYTYFTINDFEGALRRSSVFQLINTYLRKKKDYYSYVTSKQLYGGKTTQQYTTQKDDKVEIVNSIFSLFQELGQAGFCLEREIKDAWYKFTRKIIVPLGDLNISTIFEEEKIFNNELKKTEWLSSIKQNIQWEKSHFKSITPRVQSLLCCDEVKMPNQLQPNISFDKHKKENNLLTLAKYTNPEPKLTYSFSEDEKQGKINVRKLLKQKNLDNKINQYYQCLVRPKEYDMSESYKWTYLSELANAVVDWLQIVLDIDKSISPLINSEEKKTQNVGQKSKLKFDLKSVLERSLINIEQAENIQNSIIQPIKNDLEYEVRQKLSLYVNHKLSGVITWIACVIIWYKLQKNVITIFNEEIENIKGLKQIIFKKFSEIAKGQTTATTTQFTDDMFNHTFKKFNDICLKDTNQAISDYLESKPIKNKFDTETVYKYLDEIFISQANPNEYQKCINYAENPVKEFTNYVNYLKQSLIEKRQEEEKTKYQQRVLSNLKTLQERLVQISQIMKNYEDQKDDSINFFEVMKAGKKIDDDEEKEEIMSQMSSILLNALKKILDGTYTVAPLLMTLTINDVATEYSFTVKQKDPAKKIIGSPFNDLQKLVFDKTMPQEFLGHFFERLDLCKDNANFGVCTDLRHMVGKLKDLIEQKALEIQRLDLKDIKPKVQDDIIHSYVTKAIGCKDVCKFCNRKCELPPHQDENETHNCNKRGHSFRVFGGGTLVTSYNDTYPSLTTCDEIKKNTKIKIVCKSGSEIRLWSEMHDSKNRNWTTNYTKFLNNDNDTNDNNINPVWLQMNKKLTNLWKNHGKKYCTDRKYTFIEPKAVSQLGQKASQMTDSQIVIICLDDSASMFNANKDFDKAVQAGKELEQYLKKNHVNPSQVHIQLWFNDCWGVNRVYNGQLSNTIPSNLWVRYGCQGDREIDSNTNPNYNYGKCGQFQGAVRILNQEVNNLLASSNYNSVYWFFFTDGGNSYPHDELMALQQTLRCNRQRWTDNGGNHKLHPLIITNQLTVSSLCQMKVKIDEIINEIWQVEDTCALKQNVQTDQLAETMIEQFTFN